MPATDTPIRRPPALRAATFLGPYRVPLGVAAALTVLGTILDLAAPWPLKVAVDHIIGGQPLPSWLAPLGVLSTAGQAAVVVFGGVTLVAANGLIGYAISRLVGGAAERIEADLRSAAFAHLQRRSLRFHDAHRSGDLVSRLSSDVGRMQDTFVSWVDTLLPESLALVGMLVVLVVVDPTMAVAALAIIPLLAFHVVRSRARLQPAERALRDRSGDLAARSTEVLRHVRAVQAFLRQDDEQRRYREVSDAVTGAALRTNDLAARHGPIADLILAGGSALVLYLGILRVTGGSMTVGTLFVVLSYLASLYHPIRALTRWTTVLARGAASRERLAELFDDAGDVHEDPAAVPAPAGASGLTLHDVSFAYRRDAPVLDHVQLAIAPGETVCIVGPTGAGKSTLLALLLRLYDPDAGRISLGGVDLRRCTLASLRSRLALVPQDPWILEGTIADNLRWGRPDATDYEVEAAARLALVDEFVTRLPDGWQTPVGESGTRLSGGQRRRLALARALVRDAEILLLDEPTSGLDASAEALVLDALRGVARTRTMVIVTHRLHLAALADRVVVLERGRIVEAGAPADLLATDGHFARLWAHQSLPRLESRTVIRVLDQAGGMS